MVASLLWADPTVGCAFFRESARGESYEFGPRALAEFLKANGLRSVLRAHQCVNGVQTFAGMPLTTVFSSSGYSEDKRNKAGVVFVSNSGDIIPFVFDSVVAVVARADAAFYSAARQPRPKPKAGAMLVRPRKTGLARSHLAKGVIARTTFAPVAAGTRLQGISAYH